MDKVLFEQTLELAKGNLGYSTLGRFSTIYPFTTENISEYIDMFDLNNKSLLTVGSSGDQVINASMRGCLDQTVIDICPFTSYYFHLKKACMLSLDYEQFLSFLCLRDYPKRNDFNHKAFNIETWSTIFPVLKDINKESFYFWKELISKVTPLKVRENMFRFRMEQPYVIKELNLYLKDKEHFNMAKKTVELIEPKFIIGDIYKTDINGQYDNIFLSNMSDYYPPEKHKKLIDRLSQNLTEEGKMLIAYLYDTVLANIRAFLDPEGIGLAEYINVIQDVNGLDTLKKQIYEVKDSVLIYQKSSHKKY